MHYLNDPVSRSCEDDDGPDEFGEVWPWRVQDEDDDAARDERAWIKAEQADLDDYEDRRDEYER